MRRYQPVPAERYFAGNPALPVAQACQRDDAAAIVQLLTTTHVSPNAVGEQGVSLLLLAMGNHSKKAMRALLTHGADPNLITETSRAKRPTQPVAGAAKSDDVEILRLLLDRGGDPESHYGKQSALCCAIDVQRYDNLRLLLDHGANVNALYTDNMTITPPNPYLEGVPLTVHLASLSDFEPLVILLEHGADVHAPDKMGNTVAYNLQEEGSKCKPSSPRYMWAVKAKRLLEAQGIVFPVADPNVIRYAHKRAESAQRRQWETTAEGRHWLEPIRAADRAEELDPSTGSPFPVASRIPAEKAFQAWRKTQPNWVPSVNYLSDYYDDPLKPEVEEMEDRRLKTLFAADSARYAEWAKAVH